MKIVVDAFGGDNAPKEIIEGSLQALDERDGFSLIFVGKQKEIEDCLAKRKHDKNRVEIIDAQDVITCEEEPTLAIRRKPNSSICVGFKTLKENDDVKAFVSAGSTGAVLVGATLKLGRIEGISRPALCPILPTFIDGKNVVLTDSGANADCKAINLCQFAIMGSCYAQSLGIENPKVALLSNGTEDEKGNALNHEVFATLKSMKTINFVGNIEGRDILTGEYDVVVTDGFSGNVALKSMEGAINTIFGAIKQGINNSFKGKIGALLLKDTFKRLKEKLDYNNKGGALFMGVKKTVIKAHGSSKSKAFKNAVLQAESYANFDIANKITEKLNVEQLVF